MQSLSKQFRCIGLMTGTSLDALDIACIDFVQTKNGEYDYSWVAAKSVAIPTALKQRLVAVYLGSALELAKLHATFSYWVADEINTFLNKIRLENVDVIGYHGQTIYHAPNDAYTFQLGNPGILASKTGIDTVGDFRSQDVALGGQGAPLVPIGDSLIFPEYSGCLNLGGIANISSTLNKKVVAFDICAFNLVLNWLAQQLGKDFDRDGAMASQGIVHQGLLEALDAFGHYSKPTPKSLAFEQVESFYKPTIMSFNIPTEDRLASFTQHAANKIQFIAKNLGLSKVLVTGGGAFNKHFVELLTNTKATQFKLGDNQLIEFKEALVFGFLAMLRLNDEINVLNSVTGAHSSSVSGALYRGSKK